MQGMVPRGSAMGNQPNQQNQNGLQSQPQGMQQFTNQIIANLQKTPLNPGWQSTLPTRVRAGFIIQLVTALRLLPNHVEVNGAIQVATVFERNTLEQSPDKAAYEAACQDKLHLIYAARQKQAQNFESQYRNPQATQMNFTMQQMQMQQQMRNANMQNSRPAQFPPGFQTEQGNDLLQASPMPKQQQPYPQMQQQQFLPANGSANAQLSMQQFQQNQNLSQNLGRQMPPNAGQVKIGPQEDQQINMMAQQVRQKASPQEIEAIKQKLNNAPPNQKLAWQQHNIDPMAWYFRRLAHTNFIQHKQRQIAAQQQMQISMADGMNMASQPLSMPQSSSGMASQQFGAASAPQGFDPGYGGNFRQFGSQILGLQQQGLRSQEEGQVVVPASGTQKPPKQQHQQTGVMQAMPQHPSMSQPNPPRPVPNHPQFLLQQEEMQQVARMQAQAQIQNAGGMQIQPSPQNTLQGQAGGLNGHMSQVVSQSPAMPNLNRPLGPSIKQPPNHGMPPQRQQNNLSQGQSQDNGTLHQLGQQMQQSSGQVNPMNSSLMIGEQQRPQQMPFMNVQNMPPELKAKFAALPLESQRAFMINFQHKIGERQRQQMLTSKPMLGGPSTAAQDMRNDHQAQVNGQRPVQRAQNQVGSVQNPGNGVLNVSQPQDMSSMIASGPQVIPMSAPGTGQNFQQQKQQTNQPRLPQGQLGSLTEEQTRKMDEQPFPPTMLASQVMHSLFPQGLSRWGELKEWVKENVNTMPPDMTDKLKGLQRMHFQNMAAKQAMHHHQQQQRIRQQAINEAQQSSTPSQQPGPAPPAQMVPPPSTQTSMPNTNSASMSLPRSIAQTPVPSAEEIQSIRIRYPHFKDWPDERVREFMLNKKRQFMEQQLAQRQTSNLQQAQYENMQRAQNQQPQRQGFGPGVQNAQNQPQQVHTQALPVAINSNKAPAQFNTQAGIQGPAQGQQPRGQARPNNQSLPNQKGMKRNNEDDVVEVPNPNIAIQQQRRLQQAGKQGINMQKPSATPLTRELSSTGAQQQQQQQQSSQYELELRKHAAQAIPMSVKQQPQSNIPGLLGPDQASRPLEGQERLRLKYSQLQNEVLQALPPRKEVIVDQQTRERMVKLLKDNIEFIKRVRNFEPAVLGLTRSEETTKDLIRSRMMTMKQYRDDKFNVVDHFTITLQELDGYMAKMKKEVNNIMTQASQARNMARAQQSLQNPSDGTAVSPNPATKPQKQEPDPQVRQAVRQTTMQRNHSSRDNRAPAAPTSDKPPFSFNAQSPPPDGVPLAYGPSQLTQDKLSIPPTKKRKVQSQAAGSIGSSAQSQHTPRSNASPQITKASSPRTQKAGPPGHSVKCSVSNCEVGAKGFPTIEDLARHTKEMHQAVEPVIDDPFEWALEGIRIGLGINADGKARSSKSQKAEASSRSPPAMKQSTSSQGAATVKMEVGTPMSRNPTQNGNQSGLNLPRTPQDTRLLTAKISKSELGKTVASSAKLLTPPHDQWDGTSISPMELAAYFPTAIDLQSCVNLATLTPESTTPSDKDEKNSPKESDISEGDGLNISLEAESWLPPAFFDDTVFPNTDFNFADDDILGMDWESTLGSVAVEGSIKGSDKRSSAQIGGSAFDINLFAFES
ncbi:hypothetical protein MMC18_000611 [Xylographa bjoerkii]|nr:hypothetical protein [Xylographa bjoerkii]